MSDRENSSTEQPWPQWRHNGCVGGLLASLAFAMVPDGADLRAFHEYLAANELGLALSELSEVVNHNG